MFSILSIASIVLLLYVLLTRHFRKSDPREPPLLLPRIPLVGHILGFLQQGVIYLDDLSKSPVFSLSILNYKIHIITDPSLVSTVHRSRDLTFDPIIVDMVSAMIGYSPNILSLMQDTTHGGSSRYLADTYTSMQQSLVPGPRLWEMNAKVLEKTSHIVNGIGSNFDEKRLWYWIRDSFTKATCETLFGIHHPLQDSSLVQAVWDFDAYQIAIMLMPRVISNIFPPTGRVLAAHGRARAAFRQFYADPNKCDHPSVSDMVRSRMKVNRLYGVPAEEMGNSELGLIFVATTNAIPTLYWVILYIFSNPKLVSELRNHLEQSGVVTSAGDVEGTRKLRIDHTKFQERCPLLVAAYNETMRLTNLQPSIRVVREDFVLSCGGINEKGNPEGYLLKKGSLVMAPARILHLSREIWGEDAEAFRHERWLALTKVQKRAFIPFGGGKHLCPGRDFAFAEIVGTLAVLILGFEITGSDGDVVRIPVGMETKFGVAGPSEDGKALKIKVRRRPGWEDVVWEFGAGA
ncbi:related to cytochrome P450 7B1 [Phialocephala subalpina]|uniref:Related to cytochrome P450 7B1 n=1 Tax=Phialocephala subalpina TaxID=576137 RepID=A0A1L7XH87_9HELO|nr:related to cytochrome P450 7B1 [Phialocephala subalpina]